MTDFSSESLKIVRTELFSLPGVEDVCVEVRDMANEPLRIPKTDLNEWEIITSGIYITASMIAPRETAAAASAILKSKYPNNTNIAPICSFDSNSWHKLISGLSARDLLDFSLRSGALDTIAAVPHMAWRAEKRLAKEDPNNPYQGWGPKRIKVHELSPAELRSRKIRPDADPNADVCHPLDADLKDLDQAAHSRNIAPVATLLNVMSDSLLTDNSKVKELVVLTDDLLEGRRPDAEQIVTIATHIGWMAADIALGGSATKTPENYHVFSRLTTEAKQQDTDVVKAICGALRTKVLSPAAIYDHIMWQRYNAS